MTNNKSYHNSRSTLIKPSAADELRLEVSAAISEIAPHITHEDTMRNAIAYILISYAKYRIACSKAILAHICSKMDASIEIQKELCLRSFSTTPESCGYLIDHIFQTFLQEIPTSSDKENNTQTHRKALGAFYTPYEIAAYICRKTIKSFSVGQKIIDPACGTGVFLSSAAHQLCEQNVPLNDILDALHGWDKNETSLKISAILILLELGASEKQLLSEKLMDNFICKDTLLDGSKANGTLRAKEKDSNTVFNYVIANPPYDRLKPDKLSEQDRRKLLHYVESLRESGEYPLTSSGSLELYRLFMEKIFNISMKSGGRAGVIVPKSFAGDKLAYELRKEFVSHNILESILFIPEKVRAFNGVSQAFAIVIWDTKRKSKKIKIGTCNNLKNLEIPTKNEAPVSKIISAFPNGLNLIDAPEEAYALIEHLNAMPTLKNTEWIKNKRGEVDLTFYKDLLGNGERKLLRGRGISEYNVSEYDLINFDALVQRLQSSDKLNDLMMPRLVCQQIANMDSSKRLKFSPVNPGIALGNSLNYLVCLHKDNSVLYGLLGVMNSILMDWRFRITSSNNHVNNYEIDMFPIPDKLESIKELGKFVKSNLRYLDDAYIRFKIERQVLELYNAENYTSFLMSHHPVGHLLSAESMVGDKNAKAA